MRHDEADAFVEDGKKPRLLRVRDVLHHVVEHNAVVAQKIVAIVSCRRSPGLNGVRESDLRIFLEHAEEFVRGKAMATGDEQYFDFAVCGERSAIHQEKDEEQNAFHGNTMLGRTRRGKPEMHVVTKRMKSLKCFRP